MTYEYKLRSVLLKARRVNDTVQVSIDVWTTAQRWLVLWLLMVAVVSAIVAIGYLGNKLPRDRMNMIATVCIAVASSLGPMTMLLLAGIVHIRRANEPKIILQVHIPSGMTTFLGSPITIDLRNAAVDVGSLTFDSKGGSIHEPRKEIRLTPQDGSEPVTFVAQAPWEVGRFPHELRRLLASEVAQ